MGEIGGRGESSTISYYFHSIYRRGYGVWSKEYCALELLLSPDVGFVHK